jgi:Spy/CpxP family protein refolding chaperone
MRNLILLAGTAALAIAVPVAAEKGGKGAGHGGGGGKPAKMERGGGHGGGHAARASKPHEAERQAFRAERKAERHVYRAERPERRALREERRSIRDERRQDHFVRRGGEDHRDFRRIGRDREDYRRMPDFRPDGRRYSGYDGSCPPGLAKKGNGCLPPGQAKKRFAQGQRIERDWFQGYTVPVAYQSFYRDTPDYYYSYDDSGYIYRADRGSDLISAIIPLLGGGFGIGQPLPAGYDAYNVPMQYRDDYYDTDESLYRYGDNAIYEVDPQSGMIEGIVALLAGDLNVGQELPDGYDAYNLPMDYRDDYQDSDESLYRYADGNIYQVDAKTQMIQAIVEMLA